MKKFVLCAFLFLWFGISNAAAVEHIRLSRDGAGPSHIFWLANPSPLYPEHDVVGIVDPLMAAIRLYSLRRSKPGGEKIGMRLEPIGACAMPIAFRPWRLLHLKHEIQIEGMPHPGTKGHGATNREDFRSEVYSVKRNLVTAATIAGLKAAGKSIDEQGWNPAAAIQCGAPRDAGGAVGRTAPFSAIRGTNNPRRTIILRNTAAALTGTQPLTVRAETGGKNYLRSVKELEPAANGRVVIVTESLRATDGMARFRQILLLFGKDGRKPLAEIKFNDTHIRRKIGQKPLAIMPTGEVIAMGRQATGADPEAKYFRVQSCGFVGAITKVSLCSDNSDNVSSRDIADTAPGPNATPAKLDERTQQSRAALDRTETVASIFSRVASLAEFPWSVDTKELPDDCRKVAGCEVKGQDLAFVPLKGIRLSQGRYSQKGLPYAQTESLGDFDAFFDAARQKQFEHALENVKTRQNMLPGNLMDDFVGDVGVDCSALVQIAWNQRSPDATDRLTTARLQAETDSRFRCPDRLSDISKLRGGDAISISLKGVGNHVVLYATTVRFDGASEFWLVLESSSSCDGVCWSLYDPSFFSGWGLYRASNRRDLKCPPPNPNATSIDDVPFPDTHAAWSNKVTTSAILDRRR